MALHEYITGEIVADCADGLLTRREALRRLGLMGFSVAAGTTLLGACGSDDDDASTATTSVSSTVASATTMPPTTSPTTAAPPTTGAPSSTAAASTATEIRFAGPSSELIGVYAEAAEARGAVLVIHENRGLTEHIRSIPARLAADGYSALAIDLLSEEGGTAALPSEADATAALGAAPAERMIADLRAGLDELAIRAPDVGLATIGFCFGGGMTWQLLAAGEPRLAAAVPFYGPCPESPDFSGSPNAAVLGIYGALDARVNATLEVAEQALTTAGLVHDLRVYDGADHAFFNDTGSRYNADAATQAYQAMLDWFGEHLT